MSAGLTTLVRAVVVITVAAVSVGCTDGTPDFCGSLRANADLEALAEALSAQDLERASAEARRLTDLAQEAPTEVRGDLVALTDAVVDVVDLLVEDQQGAGGSSEAERRRAQLNDDLGELDERSQRVSAWALRECGLRLDQGV
jgi:hypothetical protein